MRAHPVAASVLVRPNRRGVSPVIGTILMVAITVVLGTVLYVLVTGILVPPPPPPVAVTFQTQEWFEGTETGVITSATNTRSLEISGLRFVVEAGSESTIYFANPSGESKTTGNVTIQVTFVDQDGDSRVSTGDWVTIQVTPISATSFVFGEGGICKILYLDREIARFSIQSAV